MRPAFAAMPVAALRGAGRVVRGGTVAVARRVGRARDAHGAGESGLSRLIDLSGASSAGDALIAVALAGSLFFAVPLDQARERVALYLLFTLVPFAVLSPVIGPVLDHLRAGRRYALAATFGIRAVLAGLLGEQLAQPVTTQSALTIYPVAFGLLVCSKAYALLRAAVVPRLLPPALPLVPANSRVALAALTTAFLGAGLGAAVSTVNSAWAARLAIVVFLAGLVLAARLPHRVDVDDPTDTVPLPPVAEPESPPASEGMVRRIGSVVAARAAAGGGRVRAGLRANVALRAFSGFLMFYLAFLLRAEPLGGLDALRGLALVISCLGAGGMAGTLLATLLRRRDADRVALTGLAGLTVAVGLGAFFYGLPALMLVAMAGGAAQSMSRLCLDALMQHDIGEHLRARAFARSETILQLAWVAGGAVGMFLPGPGGLGLGVAAGGLLVGFVVAMRTYLAARAEIRRPHA